MGKGGERDWGGRNGMGGETYENYSYLSPGFMFPAQTDRK